MIFVKFNYLGELRKLKLSQLIMLKNNIIFISYMLLNANVLLPLYKKGHHFHRLSIFVYH